MSEHPWLVQLNEQGYRLTGARRAVVEIMAQSTHALTPVEIYDEARTPHPALGLVTVYRTLEALEEQGFIQRVHQPEGCQAFITAPAGHQHLLLCRQCGQATVFEGDDLKTLIRSIARRTGFQITEHWLQLFGLCPNCRKEGAPMFQQQSYPSDIFQWLGFLANLLYPLALGAFYFLIMQGVAQGLNLGLDIFYGLNPEADEEEVVVVEEK